MLELAVMLKEVGLVDTEKARVQIVPLFETSKIWIIQKKP